MGDVASPSEIFRSVRMPFLVNCSLRRIWNKRQDRRCRSTQSDGGNVIHRTDADARRTKLDDMMLEIPILIGAPLQHALGARERFNLLQPRVNPILMTLVEFTILTNENLLKLRIGVFVLGLLHIERKPCYQILTRFSLKHLSVCSSFSTKPFDGLEIRRNVLKLIICPKLHREDTM